MVIIEDERDVARLLEFNLRGAGFTVASAATFTVRPGDGFEEHAAVRASVSGRE